MATWDEKKRLTNIARHGVDFAGCDAIFDGPVVTLEDTREAYGEQRLNGVGWLKGRLMHVTYTERGEDFHVISLRKAKKRERERYEQTFHPNRG